MLLKFIPLSISPRYSFALQVYTTPAQHLDSTWSSPLTTTSASATTSATTSGQTSYIFITPLQTINCRTSSGGSIAYLLVGSSLASGIKFNIPLVGSTRPLEA
ncbi:unnamed protein product [Brassica rapa]|uniref:Uncharacterized protein n=1 Tax=Brassica campestris TaxID=3711 RepID=A0A3P5Z4Z4_BRACM|nr:unnamed protein product [Brassica rapa]VDC67218.1 unnamed protein product [Brassica rapa]